MGGSRRQWDSDRGLSEAVPTSVSTPEECDELRQDSQQAVLRRLCGVVHTVVDDA